MMRTAMEGEGVTLGSIAGASVMAPFTLIQIAGQALGIPMEWLFPAP